MTIFKTFCAALLFAAVALPAWALDMDDVVRLAKAKAGDGVILAQIKATRARFVLTADDIVRLKKEGVSDAVVKAMIETAEAPAAPAPPAAPSAARAPEAAPVGTLVLENLDIRDYSVQVDSEHGNIFYYKASGAEGREPLPARASQVWRLPPGGYRLTWVAGADSYVVRVSAGGESRASLTRTSAEGVEAVYLSVFENGVRTGGGKLATLADRPAAQYVESRPATAGATTIIEKHYYPAQAAVYAPAYGYSQPDYYAGRSGYYSNRGAGWLVPGFSYDWTRGRSSYAVGWNPWGNLGFSWHQRLGRGGYTLNWGW